MDNQTTRYVLSVAEVAERLDVHANTVLEMVHRGAFRARLAGRSWRIPVEAFNEFLAGRDNPARVLSVDELAAALTVHRNTAAAMIQAGTIRAIRTGRTWKIPIAALEEFLSGRDNHVGEQGDNQGVVGEAARSPEAARQELEAMGFRLKAEPGRDGEQDG